VLTSAANAASPSRARIRLRKIRVLHGVALLCGRRGGGAARPNGGRQKHAVARAVGPAAVSAVACASTAPTSPHHAARSGAYRGSSMSSRAIACSRRFSVTG